MKNGLTDVSDHLMIAMERLNDEDLQGEDLEQEIERSKALSGVAKTIVGVRGLQLEAVRTALDAGIKVPAAAFIEHKPEPEPGASK